MGVTLYKIGEVHFRLLGTNGFHVKAKSERLTAAASQCRQNFKFKNFTCVQHVQHNYSFLFNQSNRWFVTLS